MITIEQLLESVDLNFEPRWVTKDDEGDIRIWEKEPVFTEGKFINHWAGSGKYHTLEKLHLVEFSDKHWTECIYEVPRKTTGKNEKIKFITGFDILENSAGYQTVSAIGGRELADKINGLVVAVNELKGAKNE